MVIDRWAGPFLMRPSQCCPKFLLNENQCCHALWMEQKDNKSTWYRFHDIHLDSLCSKPAAAAICPPCACNSLCTALELDSIRRTLLDAPDIDVIAAPAELLVEIDFYV